VLQRQNGQHEVPSKENPGGSCLSIRDAPIARVGRGGLAERNNVVTVVCISSHSLIKRECAAYQMISEQPVLLIVRCTRSTFLQTGISFQAGKPITTQNSILPHAANRHPHFCFPSCFPRHDSALLRQMPKLTLDEEQKSSFLRWLRFGLTRCWYFNVAGIRVVALGTSSNLTYLPS